MRIARLSLCLILSSVCWRAQAAEQQLTVTGQLVRSMAMGGESTGWSLELESAVTIDGKQMNSIQVAYSNIDRLEKLQNKRVKATGKLVQRHGVEMGEYTVLDISSIKEAKTTASQAAFNLVGTEWRLESVGDRKVFDNSRATLSLPGAGKVSGNGSCNRFFGPADINGTAIKLGPFASSRMACAEPVMSQEAQYLEALRAAERFEWKDPYLLIYCKGLEKPLRFTRMAAGKSAGQ